MRLSDFNVLTLDCYGTLIDWESGIAAALQPLLVAGGLAVDGVLERFARHESEQQAADRASFGGSNERLEVGFGAVYRAQGIGSYKPDLRHFRFMLERERAFGVAPGTILHTAQSLFHDHLPAKQMGLASAWIDRRQGKQGSGAAMPVEGARYDWRSPSMDAMVEAHRAEVAG